MEGGSLANSDLDIDLESGGNTSEEDGSKTHTLGENTNRLKCECSGFLGMESPNNYAREGMCSSQCEKSSGPDEIIVDNIKRKDKRMGNMLISKDKKSAKNSIKTSKPPRPPRGPTLDAAADLKLVKEISKLAMLKRQRIERMKAMKKMKNEKSFNNSISFMAMVVTVLFFIVIVCQGLSGSRA
ncbi:hypothetical protein LIER_00016 [Lithospermum erythrorhizon]|uniref:Transmembrane protein n=1 Tax=Lithospermum erythrorhizon TaxID=34254 RepID=A0AAV3NH08_LITER